MKKWVLVMLICLPFIAGCAAGSATAGYALKASTADEISPKARRSIIEDAVEKAKTEILDYLREKGVLK